MAKQGEKVLIVNSREETRSFLTEVLPDIGFATQSARDGREALRMIDRDRFEWVIGHLEMRGMSGFEFVRLLREKAPAVKVVMISSDGHMAEEKAAGLGRVTFFRRPCSLGRLADALCSGGG